MTKEYNGFRNIIGKLCAIMEILKKSIYLGFKKLIWALDYYEIQKYETMISFLRILLLKNILSFLIN